MLSRSIIARRSVASTRVFSRAAIRLNSNKAVVEELESSSKSPKDLASSSTLPHIPGVTPNKDIDPKSKMETPVLEKERFELPKWQKAVGESFISIFGVDMDKVRSGSVGGSKYYYMCKDQSLQFKNEDLSETAKFWYETLALPRSFSQWFQITSLHIWLLFVRMRAMPFKYGKSYQQKLVDRFFKDMELRLSEEMNVLSGRITDSYLKDFHSQLMGIVLSYDEALASNDAVLAAALWRNIFNGEKNVDLVKLEALVRYVRMQLYVLSKTSDRAFGFGDFVFVNPNETVAPLTKEEEQQLKKVAKQIYEPEGVKVIPSKRSNLSIDE
ncbi:unnamed protein product [[Candida] boidinii]|nr:unnamed protein product [[Candida] boidinii]